MSTGRTAAHDFYAEHVRPAVDAWRAAPTDLRLAKAAAVALYHQADHFWHAHCQEDAERVLGTTSPGAFRARLATRSPEYALLRDVAEAHKHVKLDRRSRRVTNADQTAVGATGYGEAPYGEGPFGGGPSVVITLDDGSKRHLSAIVSVVEKYWISELGSSVAD